MPLLGQTLPDTFGGVELVPLSKASVMGTCLGLYGSGGVGKTTTIGKAMSVYGPGLYIDAEGGASSIRHLDNIQLAQVTKWEQIRRVVDGLKRGDHPFKSIALDNMSEIQNMCISSIGGLQPQIQHWGQCTARMLELTRDVRELSRTKGIHVFLIAWEAEQLGEGGIVIKRGVKFTPSFAQQFPGIITNLGFMTPTHRPNVRKLSFRVSEDTDAKFRVSPLDSGANIPLELWVDNKDNVLADIIATTCEGKPFPADKYKRPSNQQG